MIIADFMADFISHRTELAVAGCKDIRGAQHHAPAAPTVKNRERP